MKKNEEREERKSRKILVPLATLAVASAVAVGSGATWTSTSNISASVTGGHLLNTNNHDTKTLTIEHLKPGVTKSGVVTLSEDASNDVDGTLKLVASNVADTFTGGDLKIQVTSVAAGDSTDTGVVNFESMVNTNQTMNLVDLPAGFGSATVTIAVTLVDTAGNGDQGKSASADLQFVTTATTDDTNTSVDWK